MGIIKDRAKEIWDNISLDMTLEKLKSLIDNTKDILNLSSSAHLSKFLDKIQLMVDMIGDYINGSYKNIPWKSIASIAGSLIYLLLPIDVVPDLLPIIGLLDDAFIIGLCIKSFSSDLENYSSWKYGEDDSASEQKEYYDEAEYEIIDDEEDN